MANQSIIRGNLRALLGGALSGGLEVEWSELRLLNGAREGNFVGKRE